MLVALIMPNFKILASLPKEDGLQAVLEKMEATDALSITILRKRTQYEPLRNIISGLWFAILYRAVETHTGRDKPPRKKLRRHAIHQLADCLRAGNEISNHNNNISKMISKRMRSGLASWSVISHEPGLLAIVNFSSPPSKDFLHSLGFFLQDADLHHSTKRYRSVVLRILIFMEKTLRKTRSLYYYLETALRDVINLASCGSDRWKENDNAPINLFFESAQSQDHLASVNTCAESDLSYSISLETTFNKSTFPRYMIQYDSPIFICVQSGDIHAARVLFQDGMASIYDVDPYNLGLLYLLLLEMLWNGEGNANV
ncbi:hypothetical protein HYALB_00000981 [Hymenoscyphus albidus]|uniref:Uncharacterized protein n=1 Tax=Hymenoscyphus albidus TaxID=595503 RepID=A0A9N9LWT0_9HELO|nr:hypothetical protein HYALB_00000981 [Hymenoscyphus albidus]